MTKHMAGYAHVNLCVTDLEEARDFYERKLGLEVLPRPDVGGMGTWFRVGNSQLHLSHVEKMPAWNNAFPHLAIYIPTDEFESTVETLKSQGVDFTQDVLPRDDFGVVVKTAFVKDSDGNLIEMTDVPPFT